MLGENATAQGPGRAPKAGLRAALWPLLALALAGLMLTLPLSRDFSLNHRSIFGFVAFGLLGTLGQIAAARLAGDPSPRPAALLACALMWGACGLVMALAIWLVNGGVVMLQTVGMLPGGGLELSRNALLSILTSSFFTEPFFTSLFLNLGVVHPLSALVRLGREATNLALAEGRLPSLEQVASRVDWADFLRRELRALPLFRVPLMTAVFMPPQDVWLPAVALALALLTALEGCIFAESGRAD